MRTMCVVAMFVFARRSSALVLTIPGQRRKEHVWRKLLNVEDMRFAAPLSMEEDITLHLSDVLDFERCGHLCTRQLFTRSEIESYRRQLIAVAETNADVAREHARKMNLDDSAPFLQTFNPHRSHEIAMRLASSQRLGFIAAQLLGVELLRVYQTCLFWKRPGDAPTNWHSDLRTSPLDTNHFVTAWIPLADVPDAEDGGTALLYADGSHRDLAMAVWYSDSCDMSDRYDLSDHGALRAGDVSWHHGWLLHSAADNQLPDSRFAFTVSFFADGARLVDDLAIRTVNDEDAPSYQAWIEECEPGDVLDHPLLPIVYPSSL